MYLHIGCWKSHDICIYVKLCCTVFYKCTVLSNLNVSPVFCFNRGLIQRQLVQLQWIEAEPWYFVIRSKQKDGQSFQSVYGLASLIINQPRNISQEIVWKNLFYHQHINTDLKNAVETKTLCFIS